MYMCTPKDDKLLCLSDTYFVESQGILTIQTDITTSCD